MDRCTETETASATVTETETDNVRKVREWLLCLFRKVRETGRIHSNQLWSKSVGARLRNGNDNKKQTDIHTDIQTDI